MKKVIAGINMTFDGYCDHTLIIADDELHQHYTDLLNSTDTTLYGRTTYQLMESYWPLVVQNPTGNRADDEFAIAIDNITKVVFSHTLKKVSWRNSRIATQGIEEEVLELKNQPGKDILVGSPSLIVATLNLNLVDELQINVQPTIAGGGLQLFKNINDRMNLKLVRTKNFNCGAITLYYEVKK